MLFPFLFFVSILILVFDQQNPIFIQERLGLMKRQFRIYKLRTMKRDKITKLGAVLRKTGIDELPQILNIVKGDMSFVGPRPLTVADVERLGWTAEYYTKRWNKRPGIVGLAQLSPICDRKVSWFLDKRYVEQAKFGLDIKIIVSSALILFMGKTKIQKRFYGRK
ncbi:MAG: sugar transferase [Crocinitomicaceae bacterium]|nr:sugar transferase [Crocinitomicaceae bacterium]